MTIDDTTKVLTDFLSMLIDFMTASRDKKRINSFCSPLDLYYLCRYNI